jgi:hypothetical protein
MCVERWVLVGALGSMGKVTLRQQKQVWVLKVGCATGQLLPGVDPGPPPPGAEHPEVAIKVGNRL